MTSPEFVETDDFIAETLNRPLQIIYRDENFVAVFKPAGLIVHRSRSTLAHEPVLLQTLRDQLDCHVYPVHRLDRPTAGLILFGLSGVAAAKMVDLFTKRMVAKYYQALVCGSTPETGLINQPLSDKLEDTGGTSGCVEPSTQDALTEFQTLAKFQISSKRETSATTSFSLLEVKPSTGRTHQIRRHLNLIGHPVVGDHRHGDKTNNDLVLAKTGIYRMLLTSMRLDFRHPYSGELHSIIAGRGSEFDLAISKLKMLRNLGP